jgi:hypothetical protein
LRPARTRVAGFSYLKFLAVSIVKFQPATHNRYHKEVIMTTDSAMPPGTDYTPQGCHCTEHHQPAAVNTLAIVSFVTAFLFWPVGLLCGLIARREIRRNSEAGAGLALAGIVISAVTGAFWSIFMFVILISTLNQGSGPRCVYSPYAGGAMTSCMVRVHGYAPGPITTPSFVNPGGPMMPYNGQSASGQSSSGQSASGQSSSGTATRSSAVTTTTYFTVPAPALQ